LKAQEEQFEIYLKAKRAIIAKMNLFQGIPHHVLLENPIFVPVSMVFEPSFIVRRLGKLLIHRKSGFLRQQLSIMFCAAGIGGVNNCVHRNIPLKKMRRSA
jgi:hypothetical protein